MLLVFVLPSTGPIVFFIIIIFLAVFDPGYPSASLRTADLQD